MESIRHIQKKYCTRAITAAIFTGGFLILAGQKPVGKGLIFATFFSILNFILMGETLPLRIGKSKGKTFMLALSSIYFRYIILAIPLIISIKFEQLNLFATIVGIFMVQIVILADHFYQYLSLARRKQI